MAARRKPQRLHDAQFIHDGAAVVHQLGLAALTADPSHTGPLRAVEEHQKANQAQELPEMETGHCLKCKGTKAFAVEGEPKRMRNGAEQVSGTCQEPGCGGKISKFRKAKANATAAA